MISAIIIQTDTSVSVWRTFGNAGGRLLPLTVLIVVPVRVFAFSAIFAISALRVFRMLAGKRIEGHGTLYRRIADVSVYLCRVELCVTEYLFSNSDIDLTCLIHKGCRGMP